MNLPDDVQGLYYEFLFDVQRSIRYHNCRRDFFDTLQTFTQIVSALLGTATFTAILASAGKWVTLLASSLVAIFSITSLVISPSKKSLLYADLAKRFIDLKSQLIEKSEVTLEDIRSLTKKRLEIEKDEPPVLRTLDSYCHNEEVRAGDYDDGELVILQWYHYYLKNIIDVNTHTIRPIKHKN